MSDFDFPDEKLEWFDLSDAKFMANMDAPTLNGMDSRFAKAVAEREEKVLHGAWMAGYRYVHVFERLRLIDGEPNEVDIPHPVFLPRDTPKHPREFAGNVYSYTYDLESVPDHVIRKALNGEL